MSGQTSKENKDVENDNDSGNNNKDYELQGTSDSLHPSNVSKP